LATLKVSNNIVPIRSIKEGVLEKIDAYKIGIIARDIGAGRIKKEDKIDYTVGVVLNKTLGSKVKKNEILCYLYINDKSIYDEKEVLKSFTIV